MTLAEYLYSVFWKFVVGYVWYRSLLFRPLAGLERKASLHILLWMTAAAVLALSLGFRRRKNGWISSACVFLPFGLYTVLAYAKTFRTRILLILVPTAVLAMGLTAVMFWGGRLSRRRFRARVSRWKYLMVCTAVSASVCLIGSVGWHAFLEGELFPAAVKAQASAVDEAQAQTIASNISEVLKLQPEVWQDLTTAQRINTMQTICNIEVYYLGLPCAVTVSGANLPETRWAATMTAAGPSASASNIWKMTRWKRCWTPCCTRSTTVTNIVLQRCTPPQTRNCSGCGFSAMQPIMPVRWRSRWTRKKTTAPMPHRPWKRTAALMPLPVCRNTTTASRSIWRRTDVTTANAEQNR